MPEAARLKFKADKKQHHDNTELGEVLERRDVHVQGVKDRADDDPGDQVSEHRSETELRGDRDRNNAGDEKYEGEKQKVVHGSDLLAHGQGVGS